MIDPKEPLYTDIPLPEPDPDADLPQFEDDIDDSAGGDLGED